MESSRRLVASALLASRSPGESRRRRLSSGVRSWKKQLFTAEECPPPSLLLSVECRTDVTVITPLARCGDVASVAGASHPNRPLCGSGASCFCSSENPPAFREQKPPPPKPLRLCQNNRAAPSGGHKAVHQSNQSVDGCLIVMPTSPLGFDRYGIWASGRQAELLDSLSQR